MALWVVGAGEGGEREQEALDGGLLGVSDPGFGDLTPLIDLGRDEGWKRMNAEAERLASGLPESTLPWRVRWLWAIAWGAQIGDSVVMPLQTERTTAFGRIESGYEYRPDLPEGMRHTRRVDWHENHLPHRAFDDDLTSGFGAKNGMHQSHAEKAEERVRVLFGLHPDSPEAPEPDADAPPVSLEELAGTLFLDIGFLRDIEQLLEEKGQVIFQGPPGTGKTYVARKLAKCLAGSRDRVRLVQFHPSYAYEDFVQGYRPTLVEGRSGFVLKDGPLVEMAERARGAPGAKHFLVIDEINRGNLSKVLGELYFLLEYRDEKMRLQYADDDSDFSLPPNLYIIGTMNTADRSIALVDLALRRRFSFVEFYPDKTPVEGLLRRWINRHSEGMDWVADVVDHANSKLPDRRAAIGPSYFMRRGLDADAAARIWEHDVLPYVEEQLYGERDRLDDFKLERLRREVTGRDPDEGASEAEEDSPGSDDARD
ncbi:MAG: AAA domain-containing protein [Chloroflexi bacterium]|nr:AAA domain-containing protein [Chloroflexota bacterium]